MTESTTRTPLEACINVRAMQSEGAPEIIAECEKALDELDRLRKIEEAASDVLESEAGKPDGGCACDYCEARRRLRRALDMEAP